MITLIVLLTIMCVGLALTGIALACWWVIIPIALDVCVVMLLIKKRRRKRA